MNKKNIRDINLKGKKVFVRVDFNVPMDENQNITNATRIEKTLPTIKYLLEQGAAVILACHVGRPTEAREPKFSTKPIAKKLAELLGQEVKWAEDCIGEPAETAAAALQPGEVLLLENTSKKRRTIPNSRNNSPRSRTSPLTTHSASATVHTLPTLVLPTSSKPRRVSSWKRKLTTSARRLRLPRVRSSRLSAARKFPTKSALSAT